MALHSTEEIHQLLRTNTGVRGNGPYRIFGDSHAVTMCVNHPDIFELHWYIMYRAYNLTEHLDNTTGNFTFDKINLFLSGMASTEQKVVDVCSNFIGNLCRLRDNGLRVAALSPCPTDTLPGTGFLEKIGGYDVWKKRAREMVAALKTACDVEKLDFIDIYHSLVHPLTGDTPQSLLLGDGWHLNSAAGHIIAVCVHDYFTKKGA